jgi:Leucine-rich repeat (LRR) protein
MKKLLLILLCLPLIGFGQNVYIPDANFKAYLVGNTAINTNGDTEIQLSEANAFNGQIECSYLNISDLTGIEEFSSLTELNCRGNQISIFDVSNDTSLTFLDCSYNQLTDIDITSNSNIITFVCNSNLQLISLDLKNSNNINMTNIIMSQNPNLTCISVDDSVYSTNNWSVANGNIDPQHYFSNNCSPNSVEEHSINKELLKITDLLGRETKQTNQPFFYIYDDGTVEKRIVIE